MFMPNKIKKSWNFKASFDFAKPQGRPQENGNSLQKVLDKLRPQTHYRLREIKTSCSQNKIREQKSIQEESQTNQSDKEDPFKITSYEGGSNSSPFKKVNQYTNDQRIQTPNSTRYDYMIGTINEEDYQIQDIIVQNQTPTRHQFSIRGSIQSTKDLHLYQTNNFQKIKKSQSSQNPNKLKKQLYIGQSAQEFEKSKKEYFNKTGNPSRPFIAYTDQSKNNELVYSGGFLLKPRSKYQSHDYYAKKNSNILKIQELQQQMQRAESSGVIQVKSLDNIIKQRQQIMQKNKSEKTLHYNMDIPDQDQIIYKVPQKQVSHKTSENISKTLRYLQQLQKRTPTNLTEQMGRTHTGVSPKHQNQAVQIQVSSPKQQSSLSKRPMTRSDTDHSPMVFQYPIQKVMIKHKDGSMEYSQILKDNPAIKINDYYSQQQRLNIPNFPQNSKKQTQTNSLHPFMNSYTSLSNHSLGQPKFSFQVAQQQQQMSESTQKRFETYIAKKKRQAQLKKVHRESVNSDEVLSGW